jgi:hypothetical protein
MANIERDDETERERILREHRDQWRAISAEQQADYGELQAERDRLAAQLAGVVEGLYVCANGHRSSVTRGFTENERRCYFCGKLAIPRGDNDGT